jgi:hypothetical protein
MYISRPYNYFINYLGFIFPLLYRAAIGLSIVPRRVFRGARILILVCTLVPRLWPSTRRLRRPKASPHSFTIPSEESPSCW